METPSSPGRPVRFLPPRPPRSPGACVLSATLHALLLGLAAWAAGGSYETRQPAPTLQTSRFYAVHYLALADPGPMIEASSDWRSVGLRPRSPARSKASRTRAPASGMTAPTGDPAPEPERTAQPGPRVPTSNTARPPLQSSAPQGSAPGPNDVQELRPGEVAGIGQVVSAGRNAPAEGGILDQLGFRAPTREEVGASKPGENRVAELVTGTSSACPALDPPTRWSRPALFVSVSFVVDSRGAVDHGSIRDVESPDHPQSDRRYHSHIFVVAATLKKGAGVVTPDRYDALVTSELSSHAAGLPFRPALEDGRPVRSSVLISCQMVQPG